MPPRTAAVFTLRPRRTRAGRLSRSRDATPRIGRLVLLTATLWFLCGCATTPLANPAQTLLDRDQDISRRRLAFEQWAAADNHANRANVLDELIWSDQQPYELRLRAIDWQIQHDPLAFRHAAEKQLPRIEQWPVIQYIFDQAVQRRWDEFTIIAVRRYARPSQVYDDQSRPERHVIESLNPGRTVEQTLSQWLFSPPAQQPLADQVAAWTVLCRLIPTAQLRQSLMDAPASSTLITELQAAALVLDALPTTPESLAWLLLLRHEPAGLALWTDASRLIASLTAEQRYGLSLRHLRPLVLADQPSSFSREDSLRNVQRRLLAADRILRPERLHHRQSRSEDPALVADRLCWGDLLTIDVIQQALADRALVAQLFTQADDDRLDAASEHGGILDRHRQQWQAIAFAPELRLHDKKFYASVEMVQRMYTGVAHYHFHVQQTRNSDYAGPGPGDLDFADRHGAGALVFTSIDERTLNVDYYQPGGVVVDLGVIRR
jgi:hypothetical protein